MQLTLEQILIIGFAVTILAQLVKLAVAANFGWATNRVVITWVCAGLSLVLAVLFAKPALPVFPILVGLDAMAMILALLGYVSAWLAILITLVGFAKIIYDLLLEKLFEVLGWGKAKQTSLVQINQIIKTEAPF
jgi:hypothetical protein